MGKSEIIQDYMHRLPESDQAEVLDFIEFLVARNDQDAEMSDRNEFLDYSLRSALRGMGNEDNPKYDLIDIKDRLP